MWSARLSFYVGTWALIVVVSHNQLCSGETGSLLKIESGPNNGVIQDHWIVLALEWILPPCGTNGAVGLHNYPLRLTVSSQLWLLEVGAEFHCTERNGDVEVIDTWRGTQNRSTKMNLLAYRANVVEITHDTCNKQPTIKFIGNLLNHISFQHYFFKTDSKVIAYTVTHFSE